jgi:hypothetical protein
MLLTPEGPATAPVAPAFVPTPASPIASARTLSARVALSLRWRATAGATLALSLPEASPASLELFDVAGRRLWSRDVGGLGPGEHEVRVGDGAWYPSGIYMARLTQGRRTATAHVAVIH